MGLVMASGLSWSPDGKFLALSDRSAPQDPASLFVLSVDRLEKRKLTLLARQHSCLSAISLRRSRLMVRLLPSTGSQRRPAIFTLCHLQAANPGVSPSRRRGSSD